MPEVINLRIKSIYKKEFMAIQSFQFNLLHLNIDTFIKLNGNRDCYQTRKMR